MMTNVQKSCIHPSGLMPELPVIPVTFMVPAYNEEARIETVLAHAVQWADEVIVVDKSSTDRTAEIASAYHPKVRVLSVPYSGPAEENIREWVRHSYNDWIFLGTCSEIPTRHLIEKVRKVLTDDGYRLELVWVPRRMYSLGIHDPNSPWSISNYPFLIHRKRCLFTGVVHAHIKPRNPANVAMIPYAEDCCVHHLTHPSAERFVEVHAAYARMEREVERDPQLAMVNWFKNMNHCTTGIFRTGSNWPAIFSAFCIYNLMNVLFTWEKARGLDVGAHYQKLCDNLLQQEWGVSVAEKRMKAGIELKTDSMPPLPNVKSVQRELQKTVFLAYAVANIMYHFQHPGAIPGSMCHWARHQMGCLLRWFKN